MFNCHPDHHLAITLSEAKGPEILRLIRSDSRAEGSSERWIAIEFNRKGVKIKRGT